LSLGEEFNQQVDLPLGLKYLKLNTDNEYIIDNLVNTIEELEFGENFNLKLENLPNSIKQISLNNVYYNQDLNLLPVSIEFIALPYYYHKKIYHIPKSLKRIKCSQDYIFINDYKKQHICIETYWN
jgi:hypothetical protein